MNERDFIYWLQGFLELSGAKTLNEQQVKIVKDHIALVMTKVTPNTIVGTENITIPQFSPIVTCTTSTELPNLGDTSVAPLTVPSIKSDLYCSKQELINRYNKSIFDNMSEGQYDNLCKHLDGDDRE